MEASAVPRAARAGGKVFSSPALLRLAPDARLVALIRQGVPAAFEAAYDRHHRAILAFCRHMLGDAEEAEDAVQHTFLAAYNDMISSDKPIQLRAWLFAIARNRCYSVLRARREHPMPEIAGAITEGLASQVQRRQDLRDLVRDLRLLPRDQRAALVLAELHALSHEEIAEVLGVPRDKVKALVYQARESLIATRTARETDCAEIRLQLATERGGGLRRANLRRHLRECPGCRDFRRQVERQRRQLAVVLPVLTGMSLRDSVLGAAAGGAGAGAVGGGLVASSAVKGGLVKVALGGAVAVLGTAGTLVATSDLKFLDGTPPRPLIKKQLARRPLAPPVVTPNNRTHAPAPSPPVRPEAAVPRAAVAIPVHPHVRQAAHPLGAPGRRIVLAGDRHGAPRVSRPSQRPHIPRAPAHPTPPVLQAPSRFVPPVPAAAPPSPPGSHFGHPEPGAVHGHFGHPEPGAVHGHFGHHEPGAVPGHFGHHDGHGGGHGYGD